jgi:hypothetical protein
MFFMGRGLFVAEFIQTNPAVGEPFPLEAGAGGEQILLPADGHQSSQKILDER